MIPDAHQIPIASQSHLLLSSLSSVASSLWLLLWTACFPGREGLGMMHSPSSSSSSWCRRRRTVAGTSLSPGRFGTTASFFPSLLRRRLASKRGMSYFQAKATNFHSLIIPSGSARAGGREGKRGRLSRHKSPSRNPETNRESGVKGVPGLTSRHEVREERSRIAASVKERQTRRTGERTAGKERSVSA